MNRSELLTRGMGISAVVAALAGFGIAGRAMEANYAHSIAIEATQPETAEYYQNRAEDLGRMSIITLMSATTGALGYAAFRRENRKNND